MTHAYADCCCNRWPVLELERSVAKGTHTGRWKLLHKEGGGALFLSHY